MENSQPTTQPAQGVQPGAQPVPQPAAAVQPTNQASGEHAQASPEHTIPGTTHTGMSDMPQQAMPASQSEPVGMQQPTTAIHPDTATHSSAESAPVMPAPMDDDVPTMPATDAAPASGNAAVAPTPAMQHDTTPEASEPMPAMQHDATPEVSAPMPAMQHDTTPEASAPMPAMQHDTAPEASAPMPAMQHDTTPEASEAMPTSPQQTMPEASAPAAPAVESEVTVNKKNTKVLVVEDEIDARTMFVDLLASEGYETSSAVDGVDALAKAAADAYHLILLDIVMPNKDGIEVLQEIKNNPDKYGTPIVVMLTNISGDAAVEKAMELGAAGFRLKVDTEPTQLLADVEEFLNGKVQNLEQEPVNKTME